MQVYITRPGQGFDQREAVEISELAAPLTDKGIVDEVRVFSSPGGKGIVIHVPDGASITVNRDGRKVAGITIIDIK